MCDHKTHNTKGKTSGFGEAEVNSFIFTSQLANQRAAEPPKTRSSSTRESEPGGGVTLWRPIRGRLVKTWAHDHILPTTLTFS